MSMVEKVARAIYAADWARAWEDAHPHQHEDCIFKAHAAIAAMREPNEKMLDASTTVLSHFSGEYGDYNEYFNPWKAEELWETMIDAALTEPISQDAPLQPQSDPATPR
jgi:hypothetical protein